MDVYLLSEGAYSDRRTVGIFSSAARAKAALSGGLPARWSEDSALESVTFTKTWEGDDDYSTAVQLITYRKPERDGIASYLFTHTNEYEIERFTLDELDAEG